MNFRCELQNNYLTRNEVELNSSRNSPKFEEIQQILVYLEISVRYTELQRLQILKSYASFNFTEIRQNSPKNL